MFHMKPCSKCKTRPRKNGGKDRYCKECHAAYMREWRKTHPMTPEQRKKHIAGAYAREYLKRGKIKREGCQVCGARAQMHHPDYNRPTFVVWLCRKHHLKEHKKLKLQA